MIDHAARVSQPGGMEQGDRRVGVELRPNSRGVERLILSSRDAKSGPENPIGGSPEGSVLTTGQGRPRASPHQEFTHHQTREELTSSFGPHQLVLVDLTSALPEGSPSQAHPLPYLLSHATIKALDGTQVSVGFHNRQLTGQVVLPQNWQTTRGIGRISAKDLCTGRAGSCTTKCEGSVLCGPKDSSMACSAKASARAPASPFTLAIIACGLLDTRGVARSSAQTISPKQSVTTVESSRLPTGSKEQTPSQASEGSSGWQQLVAPSKDAAHQEGKDHIRPARAWAGARTLAGATTGHHGPAIIVGDGHPRVAIQLSSETLQPRTSRIEVNG